MAWSTPLTAVSNAILTAAQWNASVRDNLLATSTALATTAGSHFAVTAVNTIAERLTQTNTVATSETTTSTSYTALATAGPAITATTGVLALVGITARSENSTAGISSRMSYAVSSATTSASTDTRALLTEPGANDAVRATAMSLMSLTAGSNIFTSQYKVSANTGLWSDRNMIVMPL